jgi:hypothetical protein
VTFPAFYYFSLSEMAEYMSDVEVIPASPESVVLGEGLGLRMLNSPNKKTEEEQRKEKKRLKHNALNSKSNRIRGACKKVLGLINNPRMDLDAFLLVKDNDTNNVTIVGSVGMIKKFKSNEALVPYAEKRTYTYNLQQLEIKKKAAVPPSPKNIPKEMLSFTPDMPGNKQVYNLQNAALVRGTSPVIDQQDQPEVCASASGIVGKVRRRRQHMVPKKQKTVPAKRRRRLVLPDLPDDNVETSEDLPVDIPNDTDINATLKEIIENLPPDQKLIVELTDETGMWEH